MSIFFLAAIIVGGMGSILGGILGAVFMTMVPGAAQAGRLTCCPTAPSWWCFCRRCAPSSSGLLIIVFLVFEPNGLAEMWRRIRRFFHLWPFRN